MPSDHDESSHRAEQALIKARQGKAERLRARGENPFANDVGPRLPGGRTYDVKDVRALAESAREGGKYVEEKVRALSAGRVFHVRGRVIAVRSTGGLSFLPLRDRT
jgi:lysyl-tRNA synthetase class 2